jgi:hypothetical protein
VPAVVGGIVLSFAAGVQEAWFTRSTNPMSRLRGKTHVDAVLLRTVRQPFQMASVLAEDREKQQSDGNCQVSLFRRTSQTNSKAISTP